MHFVLSIFVSIAKILTTSCRSDVA